MRLKTAIFSIVLVFMAGQVMANNSLDQRIDAATDVIEEMAQMPEKGIPSSLLSSAYAVAVIPSTLKAGFMLGGSYGKGILVVRQADGSWSNPAFLTLGAGSFGFQIGAQSSDIVLVFKNRKSIDNIYKGKLILGGDANVAAGPVGRHTSAATDGRLKAEIYSYSRNRGLFAGVSLEGAWLRMDKKANASYYDNGQGTAAKILNDAHMPTPAHARNFIEVLANRTPNLKGKVPASRTARNQSQPRAEKNKPEGAQVFAIDEAPAPQSDSVF